MSSPCRRLFAAATLIAATTLAPGRATADDRHERDGRQQAHEHGRDLDRHLLQPPTWVERDDVRWDGRAWVRAGWRREEMGPRYERSREVRREVAGLEHDRAAFHARYGWDARRLARYDERYLARHAELERELQRLTWYARR